MTLSSTRRTYSPSVQRLVKRFDQTPTYWSQVILRAYSRKGFTTYEKWKANSWDRNACGRYTTHPKLVRNSRGVPIDEDLKRLGTLFGTAVHKDNLDLAASLYIKIEDRAFQLVEGVSR